MGSVGVHRVVGSALCNVLMRVHKAAVTQRSEKMDKSQSFEATAAEHRTSRVYLRTL